MPKEGAELGKRAPPDAWMWARANLRSDRVDHESDRGQCLGGSLLRCRVQYKHAVLPSL